MFLKRMLTTSERSTAPASSMANPACMKNTSVPHSSSTVPSKSPAPTAPAVAFDMSSPPSPASSRVRCVRSPDSPSSLLSTLQGFRQSVLKGGGLSAWAVQATLGRAAQAMSEYKVSRRPAAPSSLAERGDAASFFFFVRPFWAAGWRSEEEEGRRVGEAGEGGDCGGTGRLTRRTDSCAWWGREGWARVPSLCSSARASSWSASIPPSRTRIASRPKSMALPACSKSTTLVSAPRARPCASSPPLARRVVLTIPFLFFFLCSWPGRVLVPSRHLHQVSVLVVCSPPSLLTLSFSSGFGSQSRPICGCFFVSRP